jgi:hypothetical protein
MVPRQVARRALQREPSAVSRLISSAERKAEPPGACYKNRSATRCFPRPTFFESMSRPWDVSKQHILLSEINAVTASMRRNSRWASRSNRKFPRDDAVSDSIGLRRPGHSASSSFTNVERQEYDLLAGFENLRQIVRETPGALLSLCV